MNKFKRKMGLLSLPKIGTEALEHASKTLRSNSSKEARSAAGSLMVTKGNLDRLKLKLLPRIQSIRKEIAVIRSLNTMRRIAFIGASKSKMRQIIFTGSSKSKK
jgi:hypothetical protein